MEQKKDYTEAVYFAWQYLGVVCLCLDVPKSKSLDVIMNKELVNQYYENGRRIFWQELDMNISTRNMTLEDASLGSAEKW